MVSRCMIFHGRDLSGSFELVSTEIPQLCDGEILIKITYTTVCRSDLYTFEGKRTEKSPTILGHEIVGQIVAFGPNASRTDLRGESILVGDRITWAIYASDPDSAFSKRGMPQKSPDLFKYGHEQVTETSSLHGGLADFIILRPNTPLIKLNITLPDKLAALINCSVSTVAAAFRLAGDVEGKVVLVSGAGMLGIIACAMAHQKKAKKILVVEKNRERAQKTLAFGADAVFDATDNEELLAMHVGRYAAGSVDIVLEFSGWPSAMQTTLNILGIGGIAIWVGATFPQSSISINAERIIRKLITIKGIHNYNEKDFIEATSFFEAFHDRYDFDSLVQGGFSLYETKAAYEYALKENPYRVGIDVTI